MDYKKLNELIADIQSYGKQKKYFLNKEHGHQGIGDNSSDGEQGEYNEHYEFYKHPELPENLFMRATFRTDSYGDNTTLHTIEFVEGKAKTITVYEAVK